MPDSPRVSVLMTVYNGAPYLREAVNSIVAQTFGDWELVVIDNGSSDDSPALLREYSDPRIRMIALPANIGRTPALRRAFDEARGEYIAVLDADDVAHPDRFAKEVALLDAQPDVVLVGTWARRIDESGSTIGQFDPPTSGAELVDQFGWTNPIVHSSAMFRATAAHAVGGYPDDLPYAQDCGLWLRLTSRGRFAVIPEPLCLHRTVANSVTRSRHLRLDVARDNYRVLVYARQHLPLSAGSRRRNAEEIAIAECRVGVALAQSGRRLQAGRTIGLAFVRNPASVLWNRVVRGWLRQS